MQSTTTVPASLPSTPTPTETPPHPNQSLDAELDTAEVEGAESKVQTASK